MSREPGSRCRLYYDCGVDGEVVAGDLVATPAGSCYLVIDARRSPSRPQRMNLLVERLPRDSARIGEEGVWPLYWYPRG